MAQPELSQTVVVLDLDDTLYQEADYHVSGLLEVCKWVEQLYGKSVTSELIRLQGQGERDLLGEISRLAGLPLSVKDSLLWIYRLHIPSIALRDEVRVIVQRLEQLCCAVVVLTDGRSISQRQKLKALRLESLPVYISEEYGSEKPDVLRYERIMSDFPAQSYVYVGDNPKKDFIAPNALGWQTIGLRGDWRNIHSQVCDELRPEYLPKTWINNLHDLLGSLC